MTADERIKAIAEFGFTQRQARFLALVMRHAGVCVPRQYASFAGIANGGEKCNALFATSCGPLVVRAATTDGAACYAAPDRGSDQRWEGTEA